MDNNTIITNFTSENNFPILSKRKSKTGKEFIYPSIQQKKEEIIKKILNNESNTDNIMKNTT